ncbi:MAG: cytochrome P450 [Novosphingobium sp.]|nr:cytochrome P450 [Novosphingobium sp.]
MSPTAQEALDQFLNVHPDMQAVHDQPWDVSDPKLFGNEKVHAIFREMRAKAPVNKATGTPQGDYWNITTVKNIQHVEALPKIFASAFEKGGMVIQDSTPQAKAEGRGKTFIAMDAPDHTLRRRAVAPAFTPAEMVRLTDLVRSRTVEVLENLPRGEQFNWHKLVSVDLTTKMLATLFDFPWEHRDALPFWSDWQSDLALGATPELEKLRHDIMIEMGTCMYKLWEQRLNAPPAPDLLSRLIHSEEMPEMDMMEFMANMSLLIVGGNDTTRNTMSGIADAFDRFPQERAKLDADPSLIPNAVQECIRFVTPVAHMRRTAQEDYELDGHLIKKGDKVILWYKSANRDESVFDEPDVLKVDRENARRHVAFGYGVHRCVGARLAEMQLRILIEEMIRLGVRPRVTGKVERLNNVFINGFSNVEVTLDPA